MWSRGCTRSAQSIWGTAIELPTPLHGAIHIGMRAPSSWCLDVIASARELRDCLLVWKGRSDVVDATFPSDRSWPVSPAEL